MPGQDKMWTEVCSVEEIPRRGARVVKTSNGCIALFRTHDDQVFALEDRCPHKNGPLSQGIVHDHSVTCPLHNWVFHLNSGEAQGSDEGQVATYATKVVDGKVHLDLSALATNAA